MYRVVFKFFIRNLIAISLLFPLVSHSNITAIAQGTCGESYTVQPGDTISDIAELCQTTVVAILEVNPEITDPTRIFVGQVIRIPRSATAPVLAITPTCGSAGNLLTILGSGFPSNSIIEISMGPENQSSFIVEYITSDDLGSIETEVYIPLYATPYSSWIVIAEANTGNIHFEATSNHFSVLGPIPDPTAATTYIVQPGDTLRSIAVKFNRNLEALFLANSQVTDPIQLSTGQTIRIPAQEPGGPQVKLTPFCGPADSPVTVLGSEFPVGNLVNLRVGEYLNSYEPAGTAEVGTNRSFTTTVHIPPIAVAGENWVVLATTDQPPITRANSNIYAVTPPRAPGEPSIYIVQPLDSLNEIAVEFNRTPNAILAANPQITNPNTLPAGATLIIPGLQESVLLTPTSGPPGTRILVAGAGFPPQSKVEVAFGKRGSQYELVETAISNSGGVFVSQVVIPADAVAGERWVVLATQAIAGEPRIFALSNEFVVAMPKPPAAAFVSIWPAGGAPGTELTIVASGFPAHTQVTFSVGPAGSEGAPFLTTWTEINGTAAGNTPISSAAAPGENWAVTVSTLGGTQIQATSDVFTVTEAGAPVYESVNVFLVDLGEGEIGCGDAVLPVVRDVPQTPAPLTAAIDALISNNIRIDSDSGLYNALYLSDLSIETIQEIEDIITVRLTGEYRVQAECDHPRVLAQIEQTVLEYSSAQIVELFINEVIQTFGNTDLLTFRQIYL